LVLISVFPYKLTVQAFVPTELRLQVVDEGVLVGIWRFKAVTPGEPGGTVIVQVIVIPDPQRFILTETTTQPDTDVGVTDTGIDEDGRFVGIDVVGEDVVGEDVVGEDVVGEDVVGENVVGATVREEGLVGEVEQTNTILST
jgi:hypothetical protein